MGKEVGWGYYVVSIIPFSNDSKRVERLRAADAVRQIRKKVKERTDFSSGWGWG
jgi:hypothetical protein